MRKSNESNQSNESNDIIENRDFRRSQEGRFLSFRGQLYSSIFIRAGYPLRHLLFSHFFVACTAECGLRTCPEQFVAKAAGGATPPTGSKYTTSIILRPWLRLGVVFYFMDVMPMFCPYPTTCEWDAYRRTGSHVCARVRCPYHLQAQKILEREVHRLKLLQSRTQAQQERLLVYQEELLRLRKEFGGNA